MEPVKLDFIYGGNTAQEGPKIEQSLDDIAAAAKAAQADVQKNIAAQRSVIKQIEADIASVEAKLKTAAPGNSQQALVQELGYAKRALEEEKAALAGVEAQLPKTAEKHVMLRTQIMQLKDNLAQMEMAGKRGTAEYQAMANELGRLNDQMGDTNAQAKILADDEKGFKGIASGVSGLAGALSAATGVAALFGAENEELARIQTRLQAVMAITIGLQQVSQTLNKDDYFTTVTLVAIKKAWAAANLRVATTLGITTVAAKALMATVTLGLSVAIGALIYIVDKLISKNKEQKEAAEEAMKAQKEAADQMGEEYGKEMSKIALLRAALNSENVSRQKKLEIIEDLKKQIPGYTAELDKEGNVIRENKKAVDEYMVSLEKSIRLKMEEKNLSAIYAEKYKIEQKQFQRPARATDEALRAEDEFNAWKTSEMGKLEQKEAEIRNRISSGGLVAITSAESAGGKEVKDKATKEAFDSEAAITDLILDIRAKRIKLEIDQQKDSLQKRLEGIRAERDEQLRTITNKEADIAAKSPGGKINAAQAKELADERAKITAAYGQKEVSETEKYQQEISDMVMSFAEERVQIAYNYNKDIEKAREMGLTADADRIEKEKQQRIDAVTLGLIEETELYKTATDDKLQLSRETTELLIEDLRRRIEAEIAAGKLSKEQGEKWLKDLDKANAKTAGKNNQNNPFAQLGTAIKGNSTAQKAFNNAPVGTSTAELAKLESAAASATASMAGAAGASLAGVKGILESVVGGLDQLGMLTEEQKKDADNIIGMVGGAADLAMGIASGNPMQIIQGSIDLVVNGMEYFDFKNKALEKSQKQHMKNVEELERAYGKLGRAIERAFSTDKAKLQLAEIDNIQQRIKENEAWVEAERKKKKRKRDNDAIDAKLKEIEDLRNLEQDKREAIVETLTGSTVMSAIDEFANAYADAFTSGEDAALKSAQVIKNILKTALIEKLKKDLQPGITTLMNMISDTMADGIITEGERAAIEAQNKKNDETAARQQKMWKDLGLTDDTTSKQGGIKGDVANMTEQTGAALTGQITAMRLNVVALLNNSKSSLDSMGKVLATLEAIKTNTDRLNRIDETLYYMKINGIKVL